MSGLWCLIKNSLKYFIYFLLLILNYFQVYILYIIESLKGDNKSKIDLILFNMKFGVLDAIKGIDYIKYFEFPEAINSLSINPGLKVLDVGSGTSIFPLFLAYKGCEVCAIDVDSRVLDLENKAQKVGLKISALVQDARKLSFPDNYFDRVTAISSIEHIRGEGDKEAMREIGRVLMPNGKALITVPYGKVFQERVKENPFKIVTDDEIKKKVTSYSYFSNKCYYYEKEYDNESLNKRIIEPSGLEKINIKYMSEKYFAFFKFWWEFSWKYKNFFLWLHPFFSTLFLRFMKRKEVANYIEPRAAFLILEKH